MGSLNRKKKNHLVFQSKILHIHLCSIIIITYVKKLITSEDVYAVCRKSYLPVNAVLMGHKLKTKSTSQKQEV